MKLKKCMVSIEPCKIPKNLSVSSDIVPNKVTGGEDIADQVLEESGPKVRKVILKKLGNRIVAVVSNKSKHYSSPIKDLCQIDILRKNCLNIPGSIQLSDKSGVRNLQLASMTECSQPEDLVKNNLDISTSSVICISENTIDQYLPQGGHHDLDPLEKDDTLSYLYGAECGLMNDNCDSEESRPEAVVSVANSKQIENPEILQSGTQETRSAEKVIAPMSTKPSSLYAEKKGIDIELENPELLRVRVAESLLLLSELDSDSKFCIDCRKPVLGICKTHGNPIETMKQTKAILSLPTTLTVHKSLLPDAGRGVFSLSIFEVGTLFGPMEGEKLTSEENTARSNNEYVWEVYENNGKMVSHYLDCINEEKSNWMRFVNCARFEEEQNLIAEQYNKLVFYKAYKKILPGDELLVWYGNAYGQELNPSITKEEIVQAQEEAANDKDIEIYFTENNEKKEDALLNLEHETEKFQCKKCKAMFTNNYYLSRHVMFVCRVPSEYQCESCSISFKNLNNYRRHKRRGCKQEKKFACAVCGVKFTQKFNLKVHLKTHLNIRDYECEECGKKFTRATFLRAHVMTTHKKTRPFICSQCDAKFARMDTLKRHMKKHREVDLKCSHCGKEFLSLSGLGTHTKRVHERKNSESIEAKCKICEQVFRDIKSHMFFVHKEKEAIECPVCNKSIKNLNIHMKLH